MREHLFAHCAFWAPSAYERAVSMLVEQTDFGMTHTGIPAHLYSIRNRNGMTAVVTDYGAVLTALLVPCRDGVTRDVVLGYDTLAEYEAGGFFGATVGRHANRISGACFLLDGVSYRLPDNDSGCNLHSDFKIGFHKQIWDAERVDNGVRFHRVSPDGEAGFPGNLDISVFYTLDEENGLHIRYCGRADRKTLINLTNHSFFNLSGHDAGSILSHLAAIRSEAFLEITSGRLPTGRILPVAETPLDFRSPKPIGAEIESDWDQLRFARGYDHCFVTGARAGCLQKIAVAESPVTGCRMEVSTDLPGVQFYTANFLPIQKGKHGTLYGPRCAFCLETEYYPDSIHFPDFPQCIFAPDEIYSAETVYRFC